MKRKTLSVFLAALLAISLLPASMFAAGVSEPGASATEGYPYDMQAWALGCSAIIAEWNELDPYAFGMMENRTGWNVLIAMDLLSGSWGISDRDDLIDTIHQMTDSGHNASFANAYESVYFLSDEAYAHLLNSSSDADARMWALTQSLGDKWGDKQIKAWDWYRMIHLASWGYIACYLELEEAYDLMVPVIERLLATFSSWEEATENYMDGYAWWSNTDVSKSGTEYKLRLQIYEELKSRPAERNLFDPSVWEMAAGNVGPEGPVAPEKDAPARGSNKKEAAQGEASAVNGFFRSLFDAARSFPAETPALPQAPEEKDRIDASGQWKYSLAEDGATITGTQQEPSGALLIPEALDGHPVTGIGDYAFSECAEITSVTLPGSVRHIGEAAFHWCTELTRINIPEGVTSIGDSAFNLCWSLTDVVIPGGVTAIGDSAFARCKGLTGITLPDGLISIGPGAFYGCGGLTDITIPASVESIGSMAFWRCESLVAAVFAGYESSIGSRAFEGCKELTMTVAKGSAAERYAMKNDIPFYFADWEEEELLLDESGLWIYALTNDGGAAVRGFAESPYGDLAIPAKVDEYTVTRIGFGAFRGREDIVTVTIPDSVTSISFGAFADCVGLLHVTIPDSVTVIHDYAFGGCDQLTTLTLPAGEVNIWEDSFSDCPSLTLLVLNGSAAADYATSHRNIQSIHCDNKQSVSIGARRVDASGEWAYLLMSNGNVVLRDHSKTPDGHLSIPGELDGYTVTNIGSELFSQCKTLKSVTIPEGVKRIEDKAFWYCSGLLSVSIPDGVTEIGDDAFSRCGLQSVVIPDSVTRIGDSAFAKCENLESTAIPAGAEIGSGAFDDCRALTLTVAEGSLAEQYAKDNQIPYQYIGGGQPHLAQGRNAAKDSGTLVAPEKEPMQWEYTIVDDCALITGYETEPRGALIIPSELDGYPVTGIGDGVFWGCENITSVVIPEGVTAIGYGAFTFCEGIESVILPSSVKSIGADAFKACRSIGSITIPDGVTRIESGVFAICENLSEISIPDSVTSIGDSAFFYCKSLTRITLPESVLSIEDSAFSRCIGLTGITLPKRVRSIGEQAFSYCSNLSIVSIPESAISIGKDAFIGCSSIMLAITKYTAAQQYAKDHNIPYTYADIDKAWLDETGQWWYVAAGQQATILAYADKDPKGALTIPDTVDGYEVTEIGGYAITTRRRLTSVTIPEGVTTIDDGAFSWCSGLESVTLPEGVERISDRAFYVCTGLTSMTLPEGVTSIEDRAFAFCENLVSVTIPSSVTSIGADAFSNCPKLTVTLTAGSAAEAHAKANDIPFVYAEIPGGASVDATGKWLYLVTEDGAAVTGYAAGEPNGMLSIPGELDGHAVTRIDDYAFYQSNKITGVIIPAGVTSIGDSAFYDCENLKSVVIPAGMLTIGDNAFNWCQKLGDVTIPEGVTRIGMAAFSDCDGMVSLTIPGSVENIEYMAFAWCDKLSSVAILQGVEGIDDYAFSSCFDLANVTIPASVTSIRESAFADCIKLTLTVDKKSAAEAYAVEMNIPHRYAESDSHQNIPSLRERFLRRIPN